MNHPPASRRRFLRYLAESPVALTLGCAGRRAEDFLEVFASDGAYDRRQLRGLRPITRPQDAESVMDFELAARRALPPAHFGYIATGVDDDRTLEANRRALDAIHLRPRRLVDVSSVGTTASLFGRSWPTPIVVCPCGSQRAFHADGELAVARATRARDQLMILSGVTTTSVEEVNSARGEPVWYQLYPTDDEAVAIAIAKRAGAAGCPVLVLTVDLNAGRHTETEARTRRLDRRDCTACHQPGIPGLLRRKPMFDGLDISRVADVGMRAMTWTTVRRIRDAVPAMRVMLKGIVTREDAELAVEHGVDCVMVSNHGGRAEESGRATIASLPEVVAGVGGRIPVLMDGGIRRGTDLFKALALGASAVGIGRPYLWGLASFGQAGVEAVLGMLQRELELVMRQMGTTSIDAITKSYVG